LAISYGYHSMLHLDTGKKNNNNYRDRLKVILNKILSGRKRGDIYRSVFLPVVNRGSPGVYVRLFPTDPHAPMPLVESLSLVFWLSGLSGLSNRVYIKKNKKKKKKKKQERKKKGMPSCSLLYKRSISAHIAGALIALIRKYQQQ
jgi:hypothetical protein